MRLPQTQVVTVSKRESWHELKSGSDEDIAEMSSLGPAFGGTVRVNAIAQSFRGRAPPSVNAHLQNTVEPASTFVVDSETDTTITS